MARYSNGARRLQVCADMLEALGADVSVAKRKSVRKRLNREIVKCFEALDPIGQAMVEDEVERLLELQRETQRLGRHPSERLS
jgi:hypothetical protein